MNLYKWTGFGHHLDSHIVLVANSKEQAAFLIKEKLKNNSLDSVGNLANIIDFIEDFGVVENPSILHFEDGQD